MFRIFAVCSMMLLFFTAAAAEKLTPVQVAGSPRITAMCQYKNVLYTGGSGMTWYDISDPLKPKKAGFVPGIYARQMIVADDRLYITARHQGVWIFDIRDPLKPQLINCFNTVELATGAAAAGNFLVTAERVYGSPVYDMRDPANPKLVAMLRGGEIQSCIYRHPLLYGAAWGAGRIYTWDLSDVQKPRKRSEVSLHGFGDGVTIDGDYLYAATGMHQRRCPKGVGRNNGWGLEILDIKTDPTRPKLVGRIKFPPKSHGFFDSWTVQVSNNIAYVGASANGAFIVDVKDKSKPVLLGHFELNPSDKIKDCVGAVAVGQGVFYIGTMRKGLHVLPFAKAVPVRRLENKGPEVKKAAPLKLPNYTVYPVRSQALRLVLDGDVLYAACGDDGVNIYDVSHTGLKLRRSLPIKRAYAVSVRNGKLFVAEGTDGLGVYDITGEKMQEIGRLQRACYTLHLISDPRWIIFSTRGIDFSVADISDLKKIKVVLRHHNRPGAMFYLDSLGDTDINGLFPVNAHYAAFYWIDFRGEKPRVVKSGRNVAHQLTSPCRMGNKFFIPGRKNDGFFLLEPGCDTNKAKHYPVPKMRGGVSAADGNIVAIASRELGSLAVYDLRDPEKPKLLKERGFQKMMFNPDRPVFWKGRLIVPGGFAGILFEKPAK